MECQKCGDDVEEIVKVRDGKKTVKLCEQCADEIRREKEVGEEAEGAMQNMMEYKGRR